MRTPLSDGHSTGSLLCTEDMLTMCLDGFLLACDGDGKILYATESSSLYIGLNQVTDISTINRLLCFSQRQKNLYQSSMPDLML